MSRCMLKSYAHTCADSILIAPVCACCTYFVCKPLGLLFITVTQVVCVFSWSHWGNVNTKEGNHGNRGNQQKEIFSVCSLVWQYFKLCPSRMSNLEKSWCLGVVDPSSGSVCLVKYFPQRISSIGRLNGAFSPELRCSPVQLPGQVPG